MAGEWQIYQDGVWSALSEEITTKLERAYNKKQQTTKIQGSLVTFSKMEMKLRDINHKIRRIDGVGTKRKRETSHLPDELDNHKQQRVALSKVSMAKEFLKMLEDPAEQEDSAPYQLAALKSSIINYISASTPLKVRKAPPKSYGAVNADEFLDITTEFAGIPPSQWTPDQLSRVVERMREVQVFHMRGSSEAQRSLKAFLAMFTPFVMSRPDVIEMLDPELIIMDVGWVPPPGWAVSQLSANRHGAVLPVSIPAAIIKTAGGAPAIPNVPAAGGAGTSDQIFSSPGPIEDATAFGAFMHGQHYASVRGFWHATCPLPPIYY